MKQFLPLIAALAFVALPVKAQTDSDVQILNKTERRARENGRPKLVLETTPSGRIVKGTGVQPWLSGFIGYLFTDTIAPEDLMHLTGRIGEHIFPGAVGITFEDGRYALGLYPLDEQSLAILRGETRDAPLQKQLRLIWKPLEGRRISFKISNVGQTPLTLSYGTVGTDENPTRDPQLAFTGTYDGQPVTASNKSLPVGDWSAPETLGAGQSWERIVDLDDYLSLSRAGHYIIKAHYTLRVQNPAARIGGKTSSLNLGFDGNFELDSDE